MSKEMREQINKVKNFNQFVNENKKSSINEVFGFSKSEKEIKLLKQKIQEAKKELIKQNFAETAVIEWAGDVPQNKLQEGINVRLNLCKKYFPSLVELLPNYFDKQGVSSIIYPFNGKKLQAYVPSKLFEFVSNAGVLSNNKAIERLMLKLNELGV